jgi:hypothetical protein
MAQAARATGLLPTLVLIGGAAALVVLYRSTRTRGALSTRATRWRHSPEDRPAGECSDPAWLQASRAVQPDTQRLAALFEQAGEGMLQLDGR